MTVSLDDWIAREAIPFSVDSAESFDSAVDKLVGVLGGSVDLLGLGEPTHGREEFLILRNRLFQRLVQKHGYTAIAIESSFPRGRLANDYVNGRGGVSFDEIQDAGFSHGFGKSAANRELVEWMRAYNADPAYQVKLQFYGFDGPMEMSGAESPRQLLAFVLDYQESIDGTNSHERRQRIESLLGQNADWENPAVMFDPTKSIGLSPAAIALRVETEEIISELSIRRPELIAKSDMDHYLEAMHYASAARQLLNYHAGMARPSSNRIAELLGIRDVMMADNLVCIAARERRRAPGAGKTLAFAHNAHLKRGPMQWQFGSDLQIWWPAGSHLNEMLGPRYAVIGSGIGILAAMGIGQPEVGTLEARLSAKPGPARFIPTHRGQHLSASEIIALPTRTGTNSYFPFTPQSISEFDCLTLVD